MDNQPEMKDMDDAKFHELLSKLGGVDWEANTSAGVLIDNNNAPQVFKNETPATLISTGKIPSTIWIAELVIVPRDTDPDDMKTIEEYLKKKWNAT